MKAKALTLIVAAVMLLATACGGQASPSSGGASSGTPSNPPSNTSSGSSESGDKTNSSSEPIKVGVVTSLSGPLAGLGKESVDGVNFAAKEINAKGGVLGRQIEVIVEDDEGKPDTGLRKAEKVVTKDGSNIIIGTVSSAIGLAIGAKLPEWNSVYIATINKTMKLTTTNFNKHIFRATQNDDQDMAILEAWYGEHGKGKTWYLVGADYEWGRGAVEQFKKIVEKNGDKVVKEAITPLGNADFSSVITNIQASEANAVWLALAGADQNNFVKQANSYGLNKKALILSVFNEAGNTALGSNVYGNFGVLNYDPNFDHPLNKEFVDNFEKEYGKIPVTQTAAAYNGAQMLFKAIEQAGTTDTQKLIEVLETIKYESIYGDVAMRPEDHELVLPNHVAEAIDDGKGGVGYRVVTKK